MSWIRRSTELLHTWAVTRFKCKFIALELDMLHGSAWKKDVMIRKDTLAAAAETSTTSTSCMQLDAKVLQSACKNVVVVAVAVLERPELYKRELGIM